MLQAINEGSVLAACAWGLSSDRSGNRPKCLSGRGMCNVHGCWLIHVRSAIVADLLDGDELDLRGGRRSRLLMT